jgi:choline-sulfatase
MGAHGALSKGRFWEESARVPLVVRWPGHVQPGHTAALAQVFDVYPTIVEALGGTLTPGRFARSLLPVATGRSPSVRDVAVSEIGMKPPLGMMLRSGSHKWWQESDREFLFDLSTDPLETNNLATAPEDSKLLQEMRARALTFLRSTQINQAEGSKSKVQRVREAGGDTEKAKPNGKP